MSRRSLLIVALAAAGMFAIASWWFASAGMRPVPPSTAAPAPTAQPLTIASSGGTTDAAATTAPGVERLAVEADLPTRAATGVVRVRVVRDGGVPVADAIVLCTPPGLDWADLDQLTLQRLRSTRSIQDRLEVIGLETRSDAHGVAMVPAQRPWPEVVGRAPGLFGSCVVEGPEPDDGFELRLVPDHGLTVRVRDVAGTPVPDLPVGIGTTYAPEQPGEPAACVAFPLATTDAAGVASLRHLQLYDHDEEQPIERMQVIVFAPGLTSIGETIDPTAPPVHGIDLQLPATGSLRVELRDRDGSRLRVEHIQLTQPGDAFDSRFFVECEDGDAWFPVVGLGHRFEARPQQRGARYAKAGPGPQQDGEVAVLLLQLPENGVTLHGRAIDAAGHALGNGHLELDDPTSASPHVSIDRDGHFAVILEPRAVGKPLDLVLRHQSMERGTDLLFRGREAHLEGPPLLAGTHQLGDVIFARAPLLATGRVVGVEPQPRLTGQVYRQLPTGAWVTATDIGIDLHTDGSFEVLGHMPTSPPLRHLLQFSADGCPPVAPIELRGGERDLVVRIELAAALEAQVLVDASVLHHPEVLVFETRSEAEEEWSTADPEVVHEHLRLRIGELVSAPSALRIRLAGDPGALIEVDDLQLQGGQVLRDPRLQGIDLRQVRAVRLRLVDASGTPYPVDGEWVPTRTDRADDYLLGLTGGTVWVGAVDDLDVLLFGEGLRPARAMGPARDTDVRVDRQPMLSARFDGLPPPPRGAQWLVTVESQQPGLAAQFSAEDVANAPSHFDCAADGTARVRIAEPGAVHLRLSCVHRGQAAEVLQTETTILADAEMAWTVATADVDRALAALGLSR